MIMRRCTTDVDPVPPPRPTPPHPLLGFRTRDTMHAPRKRDPHPHHHHHQRSNRPSSMDEAPSSKAPLAPTWTTHSNPLFHDHQYCRQDEEEKARDLLKAELERERLLRKKAEAAVDSSARDAAEERKKREAAERRAEELAEELRSRIADVGRPRSAANCPQPSPSGAVERGIGREAKQQQQQQQQQQQPQTKRKEVENPHIRRGIVGFVEFPKMLRNRRCGKKDGGADNVAANLECQKAQFRVLLKSSNRVSPVGSSSPCSASHKRAVPSSLHHP